MPKKRYIVDLTKAEEAELQTLTRKGEVRARKMKRAQVLLKALHRATDAQIRVALGVSRPMVERLRKRFVESGLERALTEGPRPGHAPNLHAKQQARVIAEACTMPPTGHARWTLALLAERVVGLGYTERIWRETVRRLSKKSHSSLGF